MSFGGTVLYVTSVGTEDEAYEDVNIEDAKDAKYGLHVTA